MEQLIAINGRDRASLDESVSSHDNRPIFDERSRYPDEEML